MLTNKERIDEMHRRVEQMQAEKRNRITRISGIAAAVACVAVIVAVGIVMPEWTDQIVTSANESMRASMFSDSTALSFIIIGILGFALGICFTAFCFRLKKWQDDKKADKQEDKHDRND